MSTSAQRIQAYSVCLLACEACIADCIRHGYKNCLLLCRECAELCAMGVRLEAQHAQSSVLFHDMCKRICSMCSDECSMYSYLHSNCQECMMACKMVLRPELFF